MEYEEVISRLTGLGSEHNRAGQARYGIRPARGLGVSVADLRRLAKEIKVDHDLALRLWDSGLHEARILASMIADPARVTPETMDAWVAQFDAWDIVDQFCQNLFRRLPCAYSKVAKYCARPEEYVKRTGFALLASLAMHDRSPAASQLLARSLEVVARHGDDDRTYVRKAVSWALRQMGKRRPELRDAAVATARALGAGGGRAGRWIQADVERELCPKDAGTQDR
ncbi:MAG: DNA alkylation repair protein [Bacillota bacterium]|nr:DNA alkylation repair protein [Bacillota bacterium]